MKPLVIRKMSEEDFADVLMIEVLCNARPWTRASFYQELYNPHSFLYVGELEGKIISYICLSCVIDEGHILKIAVLPACRRLGIATLLVRYAIDFFRSQNCIKVFLEVRTGNVEARSLYNKFGFTEVRRRDAYYQSPVEDAIEMELML